MPERASSKYLKIFTLLILAVFFMTGCGMASKKDPSSLVHGRNTGSDAGSTSVAEEVSEPDVEEEDPYKDRYSNVTPEPADPLTTGFTLPEGSTIPTIMVSTEGGQPVLSVEDYVECTVTTANDKGVSHLEDYAARIRVRGNSTAYYGDEKQIVNNKVPYRIKFNEKANLFGLNNGIKKKNWVLLKADWNMIPDDLALRLGRSILHEDNFCSDSCLVHLYINDELAGVYVLCEQCQTGKGRVDIDEPKKSFSGINTGYYIELDNYIEEPWFPVDYCGATVKDIKGTEREFVPAEYCIKSDIRSDAQLNFISKYINDVFRIIYEACEHEEYYTFDSSYEVVEAGDEITSAQQAVDNVIDLDSLVDMYILHEICCSNDVGEGSFYMCIDLSSKSKYTKLTFTSPWDFNWAYEGEPDGGYFAGGFMNQTMVNQYGDRSNPWFIVTVKQPWMQELIGKRWSEIRDDLDDCLEEERDILDRYDHDLQIENDWSIDCARELTDWVEKRINWLDGRFTQE